MKKKESAASRIVRGLKEAVAFARGEDSGSKVRRLPRDFRPPHGASIHYLRSDMRRDERNRDYETR